MAAHTTIRARPDGPARSSGTRSTRRRRHVEAPDGRALAATYPPNDRLSIAYRPRTTRSHPPSTSAYSPSTTSYSRSTTSYSPIDSLSSARDCESSADDRPSSRTTSPYPPATPTRSLGERGIRREPRPLGGVAARCLHSRETSAARRERDSSPTPPSGRGCRSKPSLDASRARRGERRERDSSPTPPSGRGCRSKPSLDASRAQRGERRERASNPRSGHFASRRCCSSFVARVRILLMFPAKSLSPSVRWRRIWRRPSVGVVGV